MAPRATRAFRSAPVAAKDLELQLDTTAAPKSIEDLKRFEPNKWFPEFKDPSIRNELNKIREMESDLITTVTTEVTPVDWEYWRSEIKHPGLVDDLKAIYDASPIPDVEAERARLQKSIEAAFNPILAELNQLSKDSEAETMALEKRAEEITYLRDNIKDLTVDEFLAKYPTVKASIEDDIANNRWYLRE